MTPPASGSPKRPKPKFKPKLNLTIREESREKLERIAKLENRSVSNLIEKFADEQWEKVCGREKLTFAQEVAEKLNVQADTPEARRELQKLVLERLFPEDKE